MLQEDSYERIHILKEIISKNNTPALEFEDKQTVQLMFKSLKSIDNIDFIVIFDRERKHFASLNEDLYRAFDNKHLGFIESMEFAKQYDLENEIVSIHKIEESNAGKGLELFGYILISYSKKKMNAANRQSIFISVSLFLIALIFSGISSYSLTKMIVLPIQQLKTFFTEMAGGEGDLTQRLQVQTNDEFRDLANEFNRFLDRLKILIGDIQQVSKTVDTKVREVEDLANQNDSFIGELSMLLDQIMDNARSLDNGARINVTSAEKATEQSEKTISISLDGQKALTHSISEMETIRNEVKELELGMTELHEQSKEIQTISNSLKDISDKTSILAINTSIEANKAGDVGLGFLVIADEIQHLSEQSNRSLNNIHRLTRNVQLSLDSSYKRTLSCAKRITEGTLNIEETGGKISSSVGSVQTNMKYIEEVLQMAKNQREMVQKIYKFIVTSSKNVSTIRRSVNNTVTNVQEQKSLVENLGDTIKNIKV